MRLWYIFLLVWKMMDIGGKEIGCHRHVVPLETLEIPKIVMMKKMNHKLKKKKWSLVWSCLRDGTAILKSVVPKRGKFRNFRYFNMSYSSGNYL